MAERQNKLLCFDPGHGGYNEHGAWDAGAVGPGGLNEADVVLEICLWLKELAEQDGYKVLLTREGKDGSYNLTPRAEMANKAQAAVFVSIHCNGFHSPQAHGTETYCAPGSVQGRRLANSIQGYMAGLGLFDRGVKEARFTVLIATDMPAVLVETAFITNPAEEKMLADRQFQQCIGEAVWAGLSAWLNG